MAEKKIRAIRFLVKPELVSDDGEHLEPVQFQPEVLVITEADWPTYATKQWPEIVKQLETEANAATRAKPAPKKPPAVRKPRAKRPR